MKICMIGLGSIGKRHIRNIHIVLKSRNINFQIDALRSSNKRLDEEIKELVTCEYFKIENLPDDYDVIFITNPTTLPFDTIRCVVSKTKHMFIEKPVFEHCDHDLKKLGLVAGNTYYVACPLRHKSIMKYVKEVIIPQEEIVSCRLISSSYLPDWRKGVDYKKNYSAIKALGGGVVRDLIHEWDYAIYLFGMPKNVYGMNGKFSNLEIDSDDIAVYIAKYENMLMEIHLDYIGQKTERMLQIFSNSERIDVDLINNEVHEYKNNQLVNRKTFEDEDCYLNEMKYFIDCVCGEEKNFNSIYDGVKTLKIALGVV